MKYIFTDIKKRFSKVFPLVKLFCLDNQYYAYDAKSNLLTEVELDDLLNLLDEENHEVKFINELKSAGVFNSGYLEKIVPDDSELDSLVDVQFSEYIPRKFVLEVTEDCNLRCKYCFYSNEENVRKHSNTKMDEETAYKSIDYYFDIYTRVFTKVPESEREKLLKIAVPGLSWWGGEPFINFDLMKKTLTYIESLAWHKLGIDKSNLVYSLVTNFTILNDEIIDFLIKNNIYLFVSLDGNENEQDANRLFANGEGSFKKVIANIDYMLLNYPEFCKSRMVVQSVLAENTNINSILNFFNDYFFINSPNKKILKWLTFPQRNERAHLPKLHKNVNSKDILVQFQIKLDELSQLDSESLNELLKNDNFIMRDFEDLFSLENSLIFDYPAGSNYLTRHFSCPIGVDMVFVSYNGDIQICCKTDNSLPLGNVKEGFDKKKLIDLYSHYYSGFRNKCNKCWAFMFCKVCPANILHNKQFYYPTEKECSDIRNNLDIRMSKYLLFTQYEELYNRIEYFCLLNREINFLNYENPIKIKSYEKN